MSTTLVPTPPTTSPLPSITGILSPDSCISLASNLRCYYPAGGTEIHHTLFIIPVALEIIFTSSLLFTNRQSGRRHLFLVVEGFLDFLLALLEVLSFRMPAVRFNISLFKAIDKAIGALSFTPLFFLMSFLYAWVRVECLPITPTKVQRIARLLLFMLIPAVVAMNMIASFVGISYFQGPDHVVATFGQRKDSFNIWIFFSSITLALLTLFQTSCFCFAFCRLILAVLTQRNIETTSKDAAVVFRGIGWMNGGIILGVIETVVGFAFYGIPIAYVRRALRLFSMALLCIGVAKGIDEVEDFGVIRNELQKSSSLNRNFRRSKLRELITNPRLSTFRQLSPTATAFHARPRAPFVTSQDFAHGPHSYNTSSLPPMESSPVIRTIPYVPSPVTAGRNVNPADASPRPSLQNYPGMSEFAQVKKKRTSDLPRRWVTIYYNHGKPTLHLRLASLDLSPPAGIGEIKKRSMGNTPEAYRQFLSQAPGNEWSRFSTTSESFLDPDTLSTYPASTMHRHTGGSGIEYRSGAHSYDSLPRRHPTDPSSSTTAARGHGHVGSNEDVPITPTYLNSTRRFSGISDASGYSAAQAEIINTPRRQLSFKRGKSALTRALLYPVPGKNVAMALTGNENEVAPPPVSTRKLPPILIPSTKGTLPSNQRSSHLSVQYPNPQPTSLSRPPLNRQSVADEDGSVVTAMETPSSTEEGAESEEKRFARAGSEYSTRSIHETLQAVREMADKFPVLPPGAIGVASQMGDDGSHSRHQRPLTAWSTDTEEFIRTRIPTEMKMKGRAVSATQPLFTPGQEIQQLPPAILQKNILQERRQSVQQQLPPPPPQFIAKPIDPFFDDNGDDGTTSFSGVNELPPLSMSTKLRHPRLLASTLNTRSMIGSPITPVPYNDAVDVIDFGTALKEWRRTGSGVRSASVRAMSDLSHIMGSSHRTRSNEATEQGKRFSVTNSDTIDEIPEQVEQLRRSKDTVAVIPGKEGGSLARIKSIGNAPRRARPQPIEGHTTRGSLHLQTLVMPPGSSDPRDVPISAVGLSGNQTISGVDRDGMHVTIGQQEDGSGSVSATTTERRGGLGGAGAR